MRKLPIAGRPGSPISGRLRRFSWRFKASLVGFLLLLAPQAGFAQGQDCAALIGRLGQLLDRYAEPATAAIDAGMEPAQALDRARAQVLKGEAGASVTMVGIGLLLHGRRDVLPVSLIRQICTFSQRNALPLHVASCAYLSALNPLGDRDEKRRLTEAEIARFETLHGREDNEANGGLASHVQALKACLPRS
ncbi:hypothetical protein [Rhabdaerophilum sp. SD176]|uniref:hypothetical protein n=1 Tax=Rhabdaerophilum sp. SD176 TaxID=2983548 RepID=UPI0024E0128C|nr:hypothetical protein [Rhabdaerophilum sp. SD176]